MIGEIHVPIKDKNKLINSLKLWIVKKIIESIRIKIKTGKPVVRRIDHD